MFAAEAMFTIPVPAAAARILSVKVVLWVNAPDVPVIVTVVDPFAALDATVKVAVSSPDVPSAAKFAVTPAGRPDAVSATVPLKPFRPLTRTTPAPVVP
jgi:hypothetical protein